MNSLTPEQKADIDAKSYEELLTSWRFAPVGDPRFAGAYGEYWRLRMIELRDADPASAVMASKRIGWDN
jgi:hypothetical protein